jgi:hypothetical protein
MTYTRFSGSARQHAAVHEAEHDRDSHALLSQFQVAASV